MSPPNPRALLFFDLLDLPISTPSGLVHLPGREETIVRWQSSVRHIDRKLRIARRACRILRWVPFVEAVFACNTVALGNADDDSDIDVLVVVRDQRLWLTRLLVTVALSLAKLRRHGKKIRDRVCLSFYLTPGAFNLSPIAVEPPDIYLAFWLQTLIPLFDPTNALEKIRAANAWAKTLAPGNARYVAAPRIRTDHTRATRLWRHFWEKSWNGTYGDLLEQQAKNLQARRLKPHGKAVIVNDAMMKFHETDRREAYRAAWQKQWNTYGNASST